MPYKINISSEAEQNLHEIKRYIADVLEAPYSARRIISTIHRGIDILADYPEVGAIAPEDALAKGGIRIIHAHKYRIYYSVDHEDKTVHVHAILHHLQDGWRN